MRHTKTLLGYGLAAASAVLLAGCGKDADFDAFIKDNVAFVAALKEAAAVSPEKAREVFDAQKGDLSAKLKKLRGVRGFQVKDKVAKEFESNVTGSLDEVCHLDIDTICTDYKTLLSE